MLFKILYAARKAVRNSATGRNFPLSIYQKIDSN